jgi:cysteine-rich repeat protein
MRTKLTALLCAACTVAVPTAVLADGDETIGTPSIPIASGTNVIFAGTGMVVQPGNINFDVPAGVTINQVLLYWQGRGTSDDEVTLERTSDNTIVSVVGTQIGVSDPIPSLSTAYRADITGLGLVTVGANNDFDLSDLAFGSRTDGAAILVIIDGGVGSFDIDILDGLDFAYINRTGDAQVTVAQTFSFAAAPALRTADVLLAFGDGTPDRPDEFELTAGGVTTVFCNEAFGTDGAEWDTITLPVDVPAGSTSITVELFSRSCAGGVPAGVPDSLSWVVGGIAVPTFICGNGVVDPGEECDDGNNDDGDGCDANCTIEPFCGDGNLDAGEECDDGNNDDGDGCDANCTIEPFCGDGNLDDGEECDDGNNDDGDGCDANCTIEPFCGDGNLDAGEECDGDEGACPGECSSDCTCPVLGGEGCTPGFWKGPGLVCQWVGYSPDDDYETVFGVDASFTKTLHQTLSQGGGGEKALGRHAVAALLNVANGGVAYAYDTAGVIAIVQAAYAECSSNSCFNGYKSQLEAENDPTPCPIDACNSNENRESTNSLPTRNRGAGRR